MYRYKSFINVSHQIKKGKCPMFDKYEPHISRLECLLYCPIVFTRTFFGVLFTDIKNKYGKTKGGIYLNK